MNGNGRPADEDLQAWIAHVAKNLPRDNFTIPSESSRDFQLLYGPCLQAARFAESYVALSAAGFGHEAGALARAAFEHAVTAHWVYFVAGGVDRFTRSISREQVTYASHMQEYLGLPPIEVPNSAPPGGAGLPKFVDMMWDLDSHSFLRTSYRTLSLIVHPTHATVTNYLAVVENETQLRHQPEGASRQYPVLYTCAIASMLAYSLVEHIVDPLKARALVEEPSTSLRLPPWLDDALPSDRRRFPSRWNLAR